MEVGTELVNLREREAVRVLDAGAWSLSSGNTTEVLQRNALTETHQSVHSGSKPWKTS